MLDPQTLSLIEEAPAPNLSKPLRTAIHQAAVSFGRHLRYRGAGTVEFLLDRQSESFYFLEMNARIQVDGGRFSCRAAASRRHPHRGRLTRAVELR